MNSYNPTRCFFLWRIRGLAGRFFGTVPREMISMILTSVLMNRFRFRFLYSHTLSFFLFHTQVGDPIRSHFLFFFLFFFFFSLTILMMLMTKAGLAVVLFRQNYLLHSLALRALLFILY